MVCEDWAEDIPEKRLNQTLSLVIESESSSIFKVNLIPDYEPSDTNSAFLNLQGKKLFITKISGTHLEDFGITSLKFERNDG
jgi:hypothetical protein